MTNGNGTLDKRFFRITRLLDGTVHVGSSDSQDGLEIPDPDKIGLSWIDYQVGNIHKDAPAIAVQFGFSEKLVTTLLDKRASDYEDFDNEMGITLPAIIVNKMSVSVSPIVILLSRNMILTIHDEKVQRFLRFRRYAESFLKKIPREKPVNDRITLLLCRIIDENNGRNFDHLREIEQQGDEMSKSMLDTNTQRSKLGPEIYKMKHALITYLNALWTTQDVLNSMHYGDADILTDDPEVLARVEFLSKSVNRQIELSEHMSEVLASGLEVLQSIYNNQLQMLNNRLAFAVAYLTIIGTALLVPNTIATALSNPAFNMGPKDEVWYTVLLLGSTLISTIFAYWWAKREGWLPKQTD